MNVDIFDQYSLVHFVAGFTSYFLKINLSTWFVIVALFEFIQNSQQKWLGSLKETILSKITPFSQQPETMINSIGDLLCAVLGWISAYYLGRGSFAPPKAP
jgi:hypothetical protein